MAANPKISAASRNLALNAAYDVLNGGSLVVYSSANAQPATADTSLGTQAILVTFALNATAFSAASAGVKTANAIVNATATGTGTWGWWSLIKSDGTTRVRDDTAGAGNPLNFANNPASCVAGVVISISSLTITE